MHSKPSLQTAAAVQFLTVDEESAGQRLDNFLIRVLKGVPKTHIYRIIRSGEVRRNKGRVSADDRVNAGDVLRFTVNTSENVIVDTKSGASGFIANETVATAPPDGRTAELVRSRFPDVRYEVEPVPGLDFARNAALEASTGAGFTPAR